LTSAKIGQILNLGAGQKGWVVGHATVANLVTDFTFLERDVGFYANGATPPNPAGSVTTPSHGGVPPNAPNGTKVGSPTYQSSGFEDYYRTAFYAWEGVTVPLINFQTGPYGYVLSDGNHRTGTFTAFRDMLAECGGWRFNNGAQMWILTESGAGVANVSSAVLYYSDLSAGTGVG
jgi:hypothetical protein